MSIDPPAYIYSLQNNIRARPISWEGAVRARTITDGDLKKIKAIDKVRKEQRKQVIEADIDGYVQLFFGGGQTNSIFQAAAKREDIVQYLLVLVGDVIEDIPALTVNLSKHPNPYAPLLPFLQSTTNPEEPIPLLTCSVLSSLISHSLADSTRTPSQIQQAIPKLNNYLSVLASSSDSGLQDISVQAYSAILRTEKARELFWKQRKETLDPLVGILRNATGSSGTGSGAASTNGESTLVSGKTSIRSGMGPDGGLSGGVGIQLLYHVLMVFWQLSFEAEMVGPGLDDEHDILPLLAQLIRISPKEKITRLLLSILRNLFQPPSSRPSPSTQQQSQHQNSQNSQQSHSTSITPTAEQLLPSAITSNLPSLLTNLQSRHLTDPDLLEDLSVLRNILQEYQSSQTNFSQYSTEVLSGHLRWSPAHRNATFWRENARRILDENNGELPKKLAELLGKAGGNSEESEGEAGRLGTDRTVLAVGCNDVGWLVKECPEMKGKLEKMGLKGRVMALMNHEDEGVRWEALRSVGEWLRYSFDS